MTTQSTTIDPPGLLLRGPTLSDGRRVDVLVRGGTVSLVGPPGTLPVQGGRTGPAATSVDLSGHLLLPAPVEPHAHLDKSYSADAAPNAAGDLEGAVAAWIRHRATRKAADIIAGAQAAVEAYLGNGVTAIRTHVDIAQDVGLAALGALTTVRDAVAGACDLQIVAFAANPLAGSAGAGNRALLAEAIGAGADVVGGCPALDPDPAACIDALLTIAADGGAPVDLHIDEDLQTDSCTLSLLARAVRAGFPHPVTASHCVSLGAMPADRVRRIADEVAAAGIAVICLPQTNLYLQGRAHTTAPPRGLTAIRALRAAGVQVAAGGDNLQDPFNCLGRADPLETAALLVLAGHDRPEPAYASVSAVARTVLGLPAVAISAGAPAELLAVRGESVRQAIANASPDRIVIHAGRVVARTTSTRTLSVGPAASSIHIRARNVTAPRRPA